MRPLRHRRLTSIHLLTVSISLESNQSLKHPMNSKVFIGLAVLFTAIAIRASAEEPCLQFEGVATMRTLPGEKRVAAVTCKINFALTTDGKQWNLVVKQAPDFPGPKNPRLLTETSYDGSTMRTRILLPPPPNLAVQKDGLPLNFVGELIEITKQQLPYNDLQSLAGALWMTYASRDFFQNLKDKRMTNVLSFAPPSFRAPESEKCDFTLPQGTAWKTPDSLTFFNEGYIWSKGPDGKLIKKAFPPPFDQGFALYKFQVLTRINVTADISIPGMTQIDSFSPSYNGGEAISTDHVTTIEIQTTAAKSVNRPAHFHHQFKEPIYVTDHRIKLDDGRYLSYESMDGSIHEPGSDRLAEIISSEERKPSNRGF
jgi:hypothetical protein